MHMTLRYWELRTCPAVVQCIDAKISIILMFPRLSTPLSKDVNDSTKVKGSNVIKS
jgi:hypothetical protein